LVPVNSPALLDSTAKSELFGSAKGEFTDAVDASGCFEQAAAGTLFFDEVAELSPRIQAMLLRVLQERSFPQSVSDKMIAVDVRVVAATNQDLEKLIREGRFRNDLYRRLNGKTIVVPPLRERGDDVLSLANYFAQMYAAKEGRLPCQVSEDALQLLRQYSWSEGNVRDLENAVRRAVIEAEPDRNGEYVLTPDLFENACSASPEMSLPVAPDSRLTAVFLAAIQAGDQPLLGILRGDRVIGRPVQSIVASLIDALRLATQNDKGHQLSISGLCKRLGLPTRASGNESVFGRHLRNGVSELAHELREQCNRVKK
jgi:transcriptional regulator with GAF, ATPase, and Fis domain